MKVRKNYLELSSIKEFDKRIEYLRLGGTVGMDTFGFDRIFNQKFYRSPEWRRTRNLVISRDSGCDLGIKDRPITGGIIVHHINPISIEDIENSTEDLFNLNNLICVSHSTHQAIHYGIEIQKEWQPRTKGDTNLW